MKKSITYALCAESKSNKFITTLLLTQQARRIKESIKEIDNIIANNKVSMKCFNDADKSKLKSLEFSVNYINKFEWMWNKQKDQIWNFNLTRRKKIKNKSDRRRYRHRKAKIAQEERRKRAQNMVLNKSSFEITDEHKILLLHG